MMLLAVLGALSRQPFWRPQGVSTETEASAKDLARIVACVKAAPCARRLT
jgi:hypothetical protein